jgi:hypothetical protein
MRSLIIENTWTLQEKCSQQCTDKSTPQVNRNSIDRVVYSHFNKDPRDQIISDPTEYSEYQRSPSFNIVSSTNYKIIIVLPSHSHQTSQQPIR